MVKIMEKERGKKKRERNIWRRRKDKIEDRSEVNRETGGRGGKKAGGTEGRE